MIQYIEKLFQETKTIILPGLGALTITNPDTKELMFMSFLKHDDGVLAGFIEKDAGISSDEAKKMVSDEVSAILEAVESGKNVSFGSFGSFVKGDDGDMEFENSNSDNDSEPAAAEKASEDEAKKKEAEVLATKKAAEVESKKKEAEVLATKKAAEVESKKKEAEALAVKKAAEDEAKKKESEALAVKKAAEDEAKKKEAEKKASIPPVIPIIKTDISTEPKQEAPKRTVNQVIPDVTTSQEATTTSATNSSKNILEKEEIAANQKKLEDLKKQKEEPKKKRKRGAGFFILLFLLLLLIAGGTFVALDFERAKEYLPFLGEQTASNNTSDDTASDSADETKEVKPIEDEIINEETDETSQEDEIPTEDEAVPDETPEPITPVVSGSNDQPFHIIAGAFSEAANAERLATKITGMGYPAKTISRGPQTLVSVQSYATRSEAQAAIPSVADAAPKGWILEWR